MAKQFVQISLATKLRLLFALAVLGIIAAALVVPWYFMEMLAEQGIQSPAAEVTRLRLSEWLVKHPADPNHAGEIAKLFAQGAQAEGRSGPRFVKISPELTADPPEDSAGRRAIKDFVAKNPNLDLTLVLSRFVISDVYSRTGNAPGSTAKLYIDGIYWSK